MIKNNLFDRFFVSVRVLRHGVVVTDIYDSNPVESIINNTFNEDY